MLGDVLDQLGSLTLEEKRAIEEAARAAVVGELGAWGAIAPDMRVRAADALRSCARAGAATARSAGSSRGMGRLLRQDDVAARLLQAGARRHVGLPIRHAC